MSNVSSLPVFPQDAKPNSNFTRHTATFHPSIWGDYFLSYDSSFHEDDSDIKQVALLKEDVRKMIVSPIDDNFLFKLNFINSVQRLGVSYHFEHEIHEALHQIHEISTKDNNIISHDDDLHHLALLFRLLRQQGYRISSDVFCKFKDQTGNFKESILNDIEGMLSLYEAAELRFHGEEILEEAYSFSLIQLTKSLTTKLSPFLSGLVHHSLGQSLHKGMPRLEARYYISFYQEDPSHSETLLTLAKLDFNMVQKLHQKEVSNLTKWWVKDLNVSTNFPFVRDRIVEACFWSLGAYYEPQYSHDRRTLTKAIVITSIIDDVYDAYGTIDELEIFTTAIERWDISALVDLPEYMKLCYKALVDVFEETEQELRKQGKEYFVKYAKKQMKRLVQAYLTESRWFHYNHTPTVEEYMEVSTISCGYAMLTTISFLGMKDTTEEVLIWATSDPKIIVAASTISRLMDDIVGNEFEHERGHVVSSLDCYMKQYNTSRQNAIKELLKLVESAWKDINEECLNPTQVPMKFLMRVVNLARMMDVLYKEEDNYTHSGGIMKDYIKALLVNKVGLFVLQHFKAKSNMHLLLSPKTHVHYMHTTQQTMSNGGSLPISANGAKPPFTRPTANFHPSIWGDHFLSYVPTSGESDSHIQQAKLLKEDAMKMLVSPIDDDNFSFKLNFIDSVQRLGVSYHFEHEIDSVLCQIHDISTKDNDIIAHNDDLHHTALLFRLLRQHGYRISSSIFCKFEDQTGKFKESLADDIQGMLSLYEAAQLRCGGEDVLEEAHEFTMVQLTKSITTQSNGSLAARVQHSLKQSLRRGLPRLEATYYMSFYQEDPCHDEKLLTFAKLDFNMLQELHLKEVSSLTKWWTKDLNVSTELPFARDRIVEGCFWILGVYFEPQYFVSRWITTKVIALASIIDDLYDAYGTIEELELFTNAIERWDICCLVDLPKYMKLCYKAILDVYEEIEQEMRKQAKVYCINYAKKEMKRLVQAHMAEARWCHCNHIPTMEEYMQVRRMSSGYPLLITTSFLGMEDTTEEVLIWATNVPVIIAASTVICRIMDDIVGDEFEQEREHVVSSIKCYMKQHKVSRKYAIEELLKLVENAWKDINDACLVPTEVPMTFLMRAVNFARVIDVLYKDEDNYTNAGGIMKDHIESLLVKKMYV